MGISLRRSRLEEMGCPFCKFTPNCSELVLVVMLKLDSSSTTTVEVSSTYAYVYIIIFIGILKI